MGKYEVSPYREGIVSTMTKKRQKFFQGYKQRHGKNRGDNVGSIVNIGLHKECVIDKVLPEDTRVTVAVEDYKQNVYENGDKYCYGKVVSPTTPFRKDGIYWGYQTRFAMDIGQVISECTFENGYDYIIGTSDKGNNIYDKPFKIPKFKHLLIVFGGPNGLESCVLNKGLDGNKMKLEKPQLLFDQYINICPFQGTRTIRSEEALLMTLSVLQPHIQANYQ